MEDLLESRPEQGGGTASLRRQIPALLRQAARPRAYVGALRELALGAFHAAAYPLGVSTSTYGMQPRLRRAEPHPSLTAEPATAAMPVILVHGYVHNRSAFLVMSRALKRAGFEQVHGFNYNPLRSDVTQIASDLAVEVDRLLAATRASRCLLVGHSMGGVVARYFVQELGGEDKVDTVLTLGTPHRGTFTSYLGMGPAAAQLRPGSLLLRQLEQTARPSPVRWIAYYSDLDLLVTPAVSGKLVHPALAARNIRVRDTGHMSMLISGEVLRSVVEHLANRDLGRTVGIAPVTPIGSVPRRAAGRGGVQARTSGA